jgi:hypothetical protein
MYDGVILKARDGMKTGLGLILIFLGIVYYWNRSRLFDTVAAPNDQDQSSPEYSLREQQRRELREKKRAEMRKRFGFDDSDPFAHMDQMMEQMRQRMMQMEDSTAPSTLGRGHRPSLHFFGTELLQWKFNEKSCVAVLKEVKDQTVVEATVENGYLVLETKTEEKGAQGHFYSSQSQTVPIPSVCAQEKPEITKDKDSFTFRLPLRPGVDPQKLNTPDDEVAKANIPTQRSDEATSEKSGNYFRFGKPKSQTEQDKPSAHPPGLKPITPPGEKADL